MLHHYRTLVKGNVAMSLGMLLGLMVTVLALLGLLWDARVITGVNAWFKPLKFGLSTLMYCASIYWLSSFLKPSRLLGSINWIISGVLWLELVIIVLQVLRGTSSHFNVSSPLNGTLWSMMGIAISILWLANFVLAILLMRQRFAEPVLALAIRLGLILAIIGMALAFLMTSPTAQQMASWKAGAAVTVAGAHTVGLADGGEGLPFFGWSTQGGDLRIPHFLGMHALQVIPLLALGLLRHQSQRKRQEKRNKRLIWLASLAYAAMLAIVTQQALRAQPLLQPDRLTLALSLALVLGSLGAWLWIVRPQAQIPLEVQA